MAKRTTLPYNTTDLFPSAASPSRDVASVAGELYASSLYHAEVPLFPQIKTSYVQNVKIMARRLFRPTSLDFETAIWEMINLVVNPRKMYRSHYYYKQLQPGRSNYTRDDPLFLILLTAFLSISSIAWGLAYSPHPWDMLKLLVYMVVVDFYVSGAVIATVAWSISNSIFNNKHYPLQHNYVEWGFCFDVHCNSFLVLWGLLYILQFLLLPLIRVEKSFMALLVGNTLYFGAVGYYFVLTFYGYNSLNFIQDARTSKASDHNAKLLQIIILAIILPSIAIGWLVTLCTGFNVPSTVIDNYFN